MTWDYATELAWHSALCTCTHERDQHEDDGCYGSAQGACPCTEPEYTT